MKFHVQKGIGDAALNKQFVAMDSHKYCLPITTQPKSGNLVIVNDILVLFEWQNYNMCGKDILGNDII